MSEPTVEPRAVTPMFGWHIPVLGDVPNVPADLTSLATGVEGTVSKHGSTALGGLSADTAPLASGYVRVPLTSIVLDPAGEFGNSGDGGIIIKRPGNVLVTGFVFYIGAATNVAWLMGSLASQGTTQAANVSNINFAAGSGLTGSILYQNTVANSARYLWVYNNPAGGKIAAISHIEITMLRPL